MAMARWLGSVWQWLGLARRLLPGSPKGKQDLQPGLGIRESWRFKSSQLLMLLNAAEFYGRSV